MCVQGYNFCIYKLNDTIIFIILISKWVKNVGTSMHMCMDIQFKSDEMCCIILGEPKMVTKYKFRFHQINKWIIKISLTNFESCISWNLNWTSPQPLVNLTFHMHRCFTSEASWYRSRLGNWMLCGHLIQGLFDVRLLCLKTYPPVMSAGYLCHVFFMQVVALMSLTAWTLNI